MLTVFNTRLRLKTQIILTVTLERVANMLKLFRLQADVDTFASGGISTSITFCRILSITPTFLLRGVCAALLAAPPPLQRRFHLIPVHQTSKACNVFNFTVEALACIFLWGDEGRLFSVQRWENMTSFKWIEQKNRFSLRLTKLF